MKNEDGAYFSSICVDFNKNQLLTFYVFASTVATFIEVVLPFNYDIC